MRIRQHSHVVEEKVIQQDFNLFFYEHYSSFAIKIYQQNFKSIFLGAEHILLKCPNGGEGPGDVIIRNSCIRLVIFVIVVFLVSCCTIIVLVSCLLFWQHKLDTQVTFIQVFGIFSNNSFPERKHRVTIL